MLLQIIVATVIIGSVSLVGLVTFFSKALATRYLIPLISLAAGSLLAVAFLDLLPEALDQTNTGFTSGQIMGVVLLSILSFFLLEKILHWHHCRCHDGQHQHVQTNQHLILFSLTGNGIHNIIDGFLVASAFMLNFPTGVAVTVAVVLHEIPHEISDFGILLYGGLTKMQALISNCAIAVLAVAGAVVFYFFAQQFTYVTPLMAAFAAGNFIYLAAADLIPELHDEENSGQVVIHTLWLLAGVVIIYIAQMFLPQA